MQDYDRFGMKDTDTVDNWKIVLSANEFMWNWLWSISLDKFPVMRRRMIVQKGYIGCIVSSNDDNGYTA